MDETRTVCPVDEALFRFFRREADPNEVEACADHIRTCPFCRLRLEALRDVEAAVRSRHRKFLALARHSLRERKAAAAATPGARRRWAPAAAALLMVASAAGVFLVIRPASRPEETLRRGRLSPLSLTEPAGRLARAPEVFHWSAVPGADGYYFELFDETLETIVPRIRVNDLLYFLAREKRAGLKPGRTYIWSVEAYGDDGLKIEAARQSFVFVGR